MTYQELVKKWTEQAQSASNSDAERAVWEQCAKELHELNLEKGAI